MKYKNIMCFIIFSTIYKFFFFEKNKKINSMNCKNIDKIMVDKNKINFNSIILVKLDNGEYASYYELKN